jgi:hypothetical protein
MSRPTGLPYPGLRSFDPGETEIFFGRDECIDGMLERLRATHFLAVLGSSGIGKSSLVKTGLITALQMGLIAEAGASWRVVVLRPGGEPLSRLAQQLLRSPFTRTNGSDDSTPEMLCCQLVATGARALTDWCNNNLVEGETLLLIIDQFEELFRYHDYAAQEEAETFVTLLRESVRLTDNIFVTITMRSNYLGRCALIEGLAETVSDGMFLVPRMTREQCRQAIEGPARVRGGEVAEPLVNRLLNDLAELASGSAGGGEDQDDRMARHADQLPLLQFTLSRMWARAEARAGGATVTLTLDDYEAVGGLMGAVDKSATEILDRLGEPKRQIVRAVFSALTAGARPADAIRRPVRYGELVAICGGDEPSVRGIVNAYRAPDYDFLTPAPTGGKGDTNPPIASETFIDITHESLIRQWSTLSSWVKEEASDGREWQRLKEDAERHPVASPLKGRRLRAVVSWLRRRRPNKAWAARYGNDYDKVVGFVRASRTWHWVRYGFAAVAAVLVVLGVIQWGRQSARANAMVDTVTKLSDAMSNWADDDAETMYEGDPGQQEALLSAANGAIAQMSAVGARCRECKAQEEQIVAYAYWLQAAVVSPNVTTQNSGPLKYREDALRSGIAAIENWRSDTGKECPIIAGNLYSELGNLLTDESRLKDQHGTPQSRNDVLTDAAGSYQKALKCKQEEHGTIEESYYNSWIARRATDLADAEVLLRRFDQARDHYQLALSSRKLVKHGSGDVDNLLAVARSMQNLAYFELTYGHREDGVRIYQECVSDLQASTKQVSDKQKYIYHELAQCERMLGYALRKTGDYRSAASNVQASVEHFKLAGIHGPFDDDILAKEKYTLAVAATFSNDGIADAKNLWGQTYSIRSQTLAADRQDYQRHPTMDAGETLVDELSLTCFVALLNGKIDEAVSYADEAAKLPVTATHGLRINFAHAYLLYGRTKDAEQLYLESKDKPEEIADIREDFIVIEKLGLAVPEMDTVRRELGI